MGEVKDEE
jgi:hypothetical protein